MTWIFIKPWSFRWVFICLWNVGWDCLRDNFRKYGSKDVTLRQRQESGEQTPNCGRTCICKPLTFLEDLYEKVQERTIKYSDWTKSWPFLAAHRLLMMQLGRCNHIKRVLAEKLENHPSNSANSASFTSNDDSGSSSAFAESSYQSGGTMDQFSQSAYRPGYGNRGGRGW